MRVVKVGEMACSVINDWLPSAIKAKEVKLTDGPEHWPHMKDTMLTMVDYHVEVAVHNLMLE